GVVECSVAPFSDNNGGRAYVQVIRDITERRQMQAERERLVYFLGERIKELRCHYAISALIERPDVDPPRLLAGVAGLLPPAFQFPPQTAAFIQSDWGDFGSPCPPATPHRLERGIRVHGRQVGRICVCYPADLPVQENAFLPEEEELLETVAQRVGETIERSQAAARIQRLSYLYETLSATNRAIVHCRSVEELLENLFDALTTHGTFPKVFIARSETGEMPLHVAYSRGIEAEYLPLLDKVLADRSGPFGQSFDDYKAGKVVCTLIPTAGQPDAWLSYLQQQGMRERAIMPLVRADKMVGLVGLYASRDNAFDAQELRLLGEMASDMSFALNTLIVDQRRLQAEQQALLSEHRFREVFDASPLPMQIRAVADGSLRAMNQAHRQWLGYSPEEVASEEGWFGLVYGDPALRQQVREHWPLDIAAARASGEPVDSPELVMRCKDGSERIARGVMTLIGDDAIIAWTDLTDIRRSERALRESEQRFRGMIEQTLTGIYVRREREFVYVNPRFCDMLGWSAQALVGPDIQDLLHIAPEMWQRSQSAWESLQAGEPSVTYSVPVRRQDGVQIELGIHATAITWDGRPAMIAMAQDVTERKRAEEQIANYVKRLEESMRATLHAVSNMVEMRDPYTAGHERRVGLIAGAIARELGWAEERCSTLEMIGLVHDIGKISVPAEILSKPTRLSALEMEMVRGHAEAGYDILKDVNFSAPVAEIIRQHHERLDGSGYPRQLKGEDILIEARVLAVADVLESMAAHRPYRPALGLDAALAEIERGRGSQFDPEAVDAIVRLLREKGYTLPQ
ncbi:MAG: PAS domain S-box protein, partial [Betaproteobacteria bacterium]|nr:PAS domain S-box protein [Betaproteobacteria bacterium]